MTAKTLKKPLQNPYEGSFNIWAFVFGWFYYFIRGKSYSYMLYVLIGTFVFIFCARYTQETPAIWLLFLLWHLFYGFHANIMMRDVYAEHLEEVKTYQNKITPYLTMPLWRLALLNVLSFGLYEIYWFCQNWEAVAKKREKLITPVLRGFIFNLIWMLPLFKHQQDEYKTHKLPEKTVRRAKICGVMFFLLTLCCVVFENILPTSSAHLNLVLWLMCLVFFVSLLFLLLPVQAANNKLLAKSKLRKGLMLGEFLVVLLGFIPMTGFILISILGINAEKDKQWALEMESSARWAMDYYPNYCEQHGYQMTVMPEAFYNQHKDELIKADKILLSIDPKYRLEMDKYWKDHDADLREMVEDEMATGRVEITRALVAREQNIAFDDVLEKDVENHLISIYEYCRYMDLSFAEDDELSAEE